MWIEGRNHTLLNLDEVLCFEMQKEMEGSIPNKTPTGRYLIKAYGTHRSKWGNAEITMFIGTKAECEDRIDYLRAKLGLVGNNRVSIA